jgi:16S rRNA (uracil1498-N3)-methyltransferase
MLHRFYLPSPFALDTTVDLTGDELHHAVRVVRVRAGEHIELFDGQGAAARGVVEQIDRERAVVRIEQWVPSRETRVAMHLAMAIINLEKFELVLQKATELGVRSIIPLETDRCEMRPERYRGKGERWSKIVFEAVKQCGRATIPAVEAPMPFDALMKREGAKLLFDADAEPSPATAFEDVTLLVGPEGGWSEEEVELARASGCSFSRLGPRRLRAETAAIVATAITAARHEDI